MQLGNASWGFRKTPLEEQLKITRDMGLSLLELDIANGEGGLSLDANDNDLVKVKRLFADYDVKLKCAATGNDFTGGNSEDVPKIKRVIDICEKLGVEYLRIFAGFSPAAEITGTRWNIMISCLNEVTRYASSKLALCVETHGGVRIFDDGVEHFHSVTTLPETLRRIMSETPDSLKFLYDPANLWAVGNSNPANITELLADRIAIAHLKDFVTLPSGHIRPAACGESEIDWQKALAPIAHRSIPALFEYENTEDVAAGCRRCLKYISELI